MMAQSDSHSITNLLEQLRGDNPRDYQDAAGKIWTRYMNDLLVLARNHLSPQVRRRVDEQDILQSMYKSFCLRQQRGEFELTNRRDLWRLLVSITENKARNAATREGRDKRNYRREIHEAAGTVEREASPFDGVAAIEPGPVEAAILVEELQRRLLPMDETLRQLALWKLQGYTNEEIAGRQMMDCAVRTVERKLAIIRQRWKEG